MQGSCMCGQIKYRITGIPKAVLNCHCGLCRSMNGAAFSTYVAVLTDEFELVQGEVKSVSVGEKASKSFCADCGTPVYNRNPDYAGLTIIHMGTLDDCSQLAPAVNIYCESQLPWVTGVEKMPSFDQAIQS